MSDPDRLAEIEATLYYWDTLYAQHGLAPLPPAAAAQEAARHVNRAQIDWLVAKLKEWQQAAAAEADLADERGREVARLRKLLEPTVIVSPPPLPDPEQREEPPP